MENLKVKTLSKWLFIGLISLIGIVLTGCSEKEDTNFSSTTTIVQIIEKGHSDNFEDKWIIGENVNGSSKIYIEEAMVWNLIEENKEYFVSYHTFGDEEPILVQISFPGDERSLR